MGFAEALLQWMEILEILTQAFLDGRTLIASANGQALSDEQRAKVLGLNAARLWNIDIPAKYQQTSQAR